MKNFKILEERIVKFRRISSNGEEVIREAELRKMVSEGGEPRSATVRLANPVNIITTFDFDMALQKFKGVRGQYTWISDFDWKQYMRLNDHGTPDKYIKGPRRWRQSR
tara:strand:- start:681 stop:1004 length:324 start_codon:yes stop_codon:yes gene_type:complete